jgi:hypothetical protein
MRTSTTPTAKTGPTGVEWGVEMPEGVWMLTWQSGHLVMADDCYRRATAYLAFVSEDEAAAAAGELSALLHAKIFFVRVR